MPDCEPVDYQNSARYTLPICPHGIPSQNSLLKGKNKDLWHKINLTCRFFRAIFYSVSNKTTRLARVYFSCELLLSDREYTDNSLIPS